VKSTAAASASHDPGEAAVGIAVLAAQHLHALGFEMLEHRVHVVDGEVDHQLARRGIEILAVMREQAEHGDRGMAGGVVGERRAAPILHVDAEHVAIPIAQRLGVLGPEEHAADAGDMTHGLLLGWRRGGSWHRGGIASGGRREQCPGQKNENQSAHDVLPARPD
jgi:hypothetical protein